MVRVISSTVVERGIYVVAVLDLLASEARIIVDQLLDPRLEVRLHELGECKLLIRVAHAVGEVGSSAVSVITRISRTEVRGHLETERLGDIVHRRDVVFAILVRLEGTCGTRGS